MLNHQRIQSVPDEIRRLRKLYRLGFADNQDLESLSASVGQLRLQGRQQGRGQVRYMCTITSLCIQHAEVVTSRVYVYTAVAVLVIKDCHKLRTPPREIRDQGMKVVLAYLKRLSQGSTRCFRTKLMFVGLGGAGKTS